MINTDFYVDLFAEQYKIKEPYVYDAYRRYTSTIFRKKYEYFFIKTKENVDKVKSVALVGAFNCIQLCYKFKSYYNSDITIIEDHPSFEITKDFYSEHFNTKNYFVNAMFEDISDIIKDVDLVVFPEYEYFVPLYMLKYYNKNKLTAVLSHHYVNNDLNQNQEIYSENDLLDQCDFNKVINIGKMKNVDSRYVYYALGVR